MSSRAGHKAGTRPGEVSGQGQAELGSKSFLEQHPNSSLGPRQCTGFGARLNSGHKWEQEPSKSQMESGLEGNSRVTPDTQVAASKEGPRGSLREGQVVQLCRRVSPRA